MKLTALGHGRDMFPETSVSADGLHLMIYDQVGQRDLSICNQGVLSGIVLRGRESRAHGEGPDGGTQPAKETYAGQDVCRAGEHERTSLWGIAIESCNG